MDNTERETVNYFEKTRSIVEQCMEFCVQYQKIISKFIKMNIRKSYY